MREDARIAAMVAVLAIAGIAIIALVPRTARAALELEFTPAMPRALEYRIADGAPVLAASAPQEPERAPESGLTRAQVRAVLALLAAFGADADTIRRAAEAMGA